MEDLRLKLEDLKRWWEDGHRQLVRLAVAGDRTHVVQRERELRRFSGSALDLQFEATQKQVRVSAQDAVTEGMAEELSLEGASSRGCCFTEGADGKRGIATSNDTSTFEATRRVVAGDGANTHAP